MREPVFVFSNQAFSVPFYDNFPGKILLHIHVLLHRNILCLIKILSFFVQVLKRLK